jgi:hypothetical protein
LVGGVFLDQVHYLKRDRQDLGGLFRRNTGRVRVFAIEQWGKFRFPNLFKNLLRAAEKIVDVTVYFFETGGDALFKRRHISKEWYLAGTLPRGKARFLYSHLVTPRFV